MSTTPTISLNDASELACSAVRTTLDTGATVDVVASRAVELRDREGRLVFRYATDGSLTVAAPSGDLILEAPSGAVRIAARESIVLDAPTAIVRAERARLVATSVETVVGEALHVADRIEIRATRLVTRAVDVLRDATGLVEERAGRVRLLVADLLRVESRTTTMLSEHETSIDGSRVHLG